MNHVQHAQDMRKCDEKRILLLPNVHASLYIIYTLSWYPEVLMHCIFYSFFLFHVSCSEKNNCYSKQSAMVFEIPATVGSQLLLLANLAANLATTALAPRWSI